LESLPGPKFSKFALDDDNDRSRRIPMRRRGLSGTLSFEAVAIHSQGTVVYVNPPAVTLLGGDNPGEFIGRPICDFVHPDYWNRHRRACSRWGSKARGCPWSKKGLSDSTEPVWMSRSHPCRLPTRASPPYNPSSAMSARANRPRPSENESGCASLRIFQGQSRPLSPVV